MQKVEGNAHRWCGRGSGRSMARLLLRDHLGGSKKPRKLLVQCNFEAGNASREASTQQTIPNTLYEADAFGVMEISKIRLW